MWKGTGRPCEEGARTLRSYIAPAVNDTLEQGWEEWTEAAVTTLLKTLLAWDDVESPYAPNTFGFEPLTPRLPRIKPVTNNVRTVSRKTTCAPQSHLRYLDSRVSKGKINERSVQRRRPWLLAKSGKDQA